MTTSGQAWADVDVFVPERWEMDWRPRAAAIPGKLERETKPHLDCSTRDRIMSSNFLARLGPGYTSRDGFSTNGSSTISTWVKLRQMRCLL